MQGYTQLDAITGKVVTTGGLSDIVVPPGVLRVPVATTNVRTNINLDAGAAVTGAANFSTPVKVIDALGAAHVITIDFQKTAAGAWTYTATVPQADVTVGGAGVFTLATGPLTFDGTGVLTAPAADLLFTAPPTWANGAVGTNITWDITPPPADTPSITSFATKSETSLLTQNGAQAGQISNISVDRRWADHRHLRRRTDDVGRPAGDGHLQQPEGAGEARRPIASARARRQEFPTSARPAAAAAAR